MRSPTMMLALVALAVTIGSLAVWAATDRHYYTKFAVVEQVETAVDPDDPLAQTGFYDDDVRVETVHRDEFHLGLFPTPQGPLDPHLLSVLSMSGPAWGLTLALAWWLRRRARRDGMSTAPAIG